MEICEWTSQRLVLRDAPGRVWVIRSIFALFILGGLICLSLVLGNIGKSERPLREWEFYLGLAVGCGVLLASLAMLGQSPRSRLIFDRDPGRVTVDRSGPIFGRELRSYALADILAVGVLETGRDGDGDSIREAFLELAGGNRVLLTSLGTGREGLEQTAARIREFLGPAQGPSRL
ncbi:MAG: hypothetical protein ACKVOI_05395 [Dongiaceae bacterium]